MSTPEGKVKRMIKRKLEQLGAYYFMPVQNGMGAPALDFFCCYEGRFFAIEAKAPGRKPTARQELTILEIAKRGGEAFVVDSEAAMLLVTEWAKRSPGQGGGTGAKGSNRGVST